MSGIILSILASTAASVPEPAIGDAYQGGFYAGLFSVNADGVATHRLVVAPKSSGEFVALSGIGTQGTNTGATSQFNGATNTASYAANGSALATSVQNLVIGAYDDWYIPAQKEMEQLYFYFKPGNAGSNNTDRGSNAYAVPQRSNYTSSVPAITTLSAWRADLSGAEAFNTDTESTSWAGYWDSTQVSATKGHRRFFRTGYYSRGPYGGTYKSYNGRTRAIRKVAI